MIYKLRMLLFLLLLMEPYRLIHQQYADVFPCSNIENRQGPLFFAQNMPLELCCETKDKYCENKTLSDILTLLPTNESICNETCRTEKIHRLGVCVVKFIDNNATAAGVEEYTCKFNDAILVQTIVAVLEKPITPVIRSLTYTTNGTITLTFDRGVPNKDFIDTYIVTLNSTMNSITINFTICNGTDTICNNEICICKASNTEQIPVANMVTIRVIAVRSNITSESSRNYPIAAVLLPDPVKRLTVNNISTHDAYIQFCMSENVVGWYNFMCLNGAPLKYNVWVITTQDIPEILNVTIQAVSEPYNYKCMRVHLYLTAFTNYTVIVSDSGGGGESQKTKIEFSTKQKVPDYSPLLDEFSFSRQNTSNGTQVLIVFWKALPRVAQGGSNFSYYIEIENATSENSYKVNITTPETFAVINKDLPEGPLTAKIWSLNGIGKSINHTRLNIPSQSDTAVPEAIVELNNDKAVIYVNTVNLEKNALLGIQWCTNYSDVNNNVPSICQEYPQAAAFNLTADGSKIQKFEILTSKVDNQGQVLEYRTIEYYVLQYLDIRPDEEMLVNATVTLRPADGTKTVLDFDFYDDTFDQNNNNLYYDYDDVSNLRRRRNAENFPKVFLSIKKEDSGLNSGIKPINCYFDKTKVQVSLDVSQSKGQLHWFQNCDTGTFMVKYFNVYFSNDRQCKENQNYLTGIENTIFQVNVLELPEKVQFACIQSCRDGYCTSDFHKTSITYPQEISQNYDTIIIIVIVILVIVFVALITFICCMQRRRGKRITRELNAYGTIDLSTNSQKTILDDLNTKNLGAVPEIPGRTTERSISMGSTDSGRGTCLFDDSKDHKKISISSELHMKISGIEESTGSEKNCCIIDIKSSNNSDRSTETSNESSQCSNSSNESHSMGSHCDGEDSSEWHMQQQQAFENNGLSFRPNNSGSHDSSESSSSSTCTSASDGASVCNDMAGDCHLNIQQLRRNNQSSSSDDDSSFVINIQDKFPHSESGRNGDLMRLMSSESESSSDVDNERTPISITDRNRIC